MAILSPRTALGRHFRMNCFSRSSAVIRSYPANDSAHRWRPLRVCIAEARRGAAIRCSAVVRLSPFVSCRCIETVSPPADKNLVNQDQQVRQAPWVIASRLVDFGLQESDAVDLTFYKKASEVNITARPTVAL